MSQLDILVLTVIFLGPQIWSCVSTDLIYKSPFISLPSAMLGEPPMPQQFRVDLTHPLPSLLLPPFLRHLDLSPGRLHQPLRGHSDRIWMNLPGTALNYFQNANLITFQ